MLQRVLIWARAELGARFGTGEWVMLVCIVVVPVALAWRFASHSYFFLDDLGHLYWAQHSQFSLSYAFDPAWEHLVPAYRLTYLALYKLAPMNWDAALAILVACHAISAVLFQRILTLLFGRAWWTYALVLAWAISVVYLPTFAWFSAGLHRIPAITATLASIHGYLCWRLTGRVPWLAWSLVAMIIGLGFHEKTVLVPLYLVLMRILLLDPTARLGDSLRSVRDEWRVWLLYATVSSAFILAYALGPYQRAETVPLGELLSYLGVFWAEGFTPMLLGVHVPQYGHTGWDEIVIVVGQLALVGLVAWSVARRRSAWRAWAFLILAVVANMLILIGRVAQLGPDTAAYLVYYYTESALFVPFAVAFAFAVPRLPARVAAVESTAPVETTKRWYGYREPEVERSGFRLPTLRVGAATAVALTAYLGVTLATTESFSKPWSAQPPTVRIASGRLARMYFDNLRGDLAAVRRTGVRPSLLDHDVPEWTLGQLMDLDQSARQAGVRYTLLSSVVPLFDKQVTFNQPQGLFIVRPDGHLQRTHFLAAAGGSPAELRRSGLLLTSLARLKRSRDEWCVVPEGFGSFLEWDPSPPLIGHDWWLRVTYRNVPAEPFSVENNSGLGWVPEGAKLPPMGDAGTTFVPLDELPSPAVPTAAGVRLGVPPFGRLCLRSLEIGFFDPPAPSPNAPLPG
jgi:hypothetical protein